jgi:hypothetical protein
MGGGKAHGSSGGGGGRLLVDGQGPDSIEESDGEGYGGGGSGHTAGKPGTIIFFYN